MLLDSSILYDEDEYIRTEDIPNILQGFLAWIMKSKDPLKTLETLANTHVPEVYNNVNIIGSIIFPYIEGAPEPLDSDSANDELKAKLEGLEDLIAKMHSAYDQVALQIGDATQLFNTFNVTFEDGIEGLEQTKQKLVRTCQVPGCNNQLEKWQHHAAKYCDECRKTGKVKQMYNKRHSQKAKMEE